MESQEFQKLELEQLEDIEAKEQIQENAQEELPATTMTLPTCINLYAEAMRCVSCRFIPIPPLFTCENGHTYCQGCGLSNKECILEDQKNEDFPCRKPIVQTPSAFYEAVFLGAEFKCPNSALGCDDRFTGQQIIDGQMSLDKCLFKKK